MKRTMVAVAVVGAVVLLASAAFAWGPWAGCGMGPGGFGPGFGPGMSGMNLSPDQLTKVQEIRREAYAAMAKVRGEMVAKVEELQTLFREPTLDRDEIAAKHKETEALRTQMAEKALATRIAAAEVLTPEQRAQLPAFGPGMGMGPRMGFGPRW